jgi:3-hydroxyisobutyrate dehydrogenase
VKATVGLIGIGRVGLPVCANLVRAGFQVIASDCRSEREKDVRAAGAGWAAETRLVADAADVLITILPGPAELQDVMAVAILALRPGTTWIDMTSSTPAVGRTLVARAHARGVECLDAPVGGGVAAAETRELQLFVGGAVETVERRRGLLEALGSIDHVGDHGAGYTTKLLVNLLWFGQAVAAGEALLLARRAGIDLALLRSALGRSAAASEFIRRDLDGLLDGDYLESFGLDRCCEELDAVVALADEHAVPFELSALVRRCYQRALQRYGPVDGELLAVALLEEQAGVRLRRST